MNHWTELSVAYANQRNYLDGLFKVYPCIPEGIRDIDAKLWQPLEQKFKAKDKTGFIKGLLELELFPIKDSYVAYLRHDKAALDRNPSTVDRIWGRLQELGLNHIYESCSQPKETNRQIGPLFRNWLHSGVMGVDSLPLGKFCDTTKNALLNAGDNESKLFAKKYLGYSANKGLDLVARFSGKYVVGEAKFLTDFGGHQNAQLEDAKRLLRLKHIKAVKIAILDGVLYITGRNKMHSFLTKDKHQYNIMSALVLREFLYQA